MGVSLGLGLDSSFFVYNLFCKWLGCTQIVLTGWIMLPLPVLLGIIMAKAIAGLHLEDY
jgi:hypothetical protein